MDAAMIWQGHARATEFLEYICLKCQRSDQSGAKELPKNSNKCDNIQQQRGAIFVSRPLKLHLKEYEDFGSQSGDANLYGYVLNDSVNLIDPQGTCPWCVSGAVGAMFGGAAGALTAYANNTDVGQGALIGGATGFAIGSGSALFGAAAQLSGVGVAGQAFSSGLGGAFGGFFGNLLSQIGITGNASLASAGMSALTGGAGGACGPILGSGTAGEFSSNILLFPYDIITGKK